MAKNKEKLKRLKKQQKERMAYNKEKRECDQKEREQKAKQERQQVSQILQRLEETSLASPDWMLEEEEKKQIIFVLDHFRRSDTLLMEWKLMEAVQSLILCCEQLYSEELQKDEEWKDSAVQTIVNHCRKDAKRIQRIENYRIPSERKLFLYIEWLKRETRKGVIVMILEFICRQLSDYYLKQCSIFVLSWAEMMLFLTMRKAWYYSAKKVYFPNKEEIPENMFTTWMLENKSLYALSGVVSEGTEDLELPVKSRKNPPRYNKKESVLFLRESNEINPRMYLPDVLPEQIPQKEYDGWMDEFLSGILLSNILYIPNVEEYLIKMTTSMLASEDWDQEMLLILLYNIREFLNFLWEAEDLPLLQRSVSRHYIRTLLISEHADIQTAGTGSLIAPVYVRDGIVLLRSERRKKPAVACAHYLPGLTVQEMFERYGTEEPREILLNWDFDTKHLFFDHEGYFGWGLREMTLDAPAREKRRVGWDRFYAENPISGKKLPSIRDKIKEASIFMVCEGTDSICAKEYVCTATPRNPFEADMKKGVEAYRSWRYVEAAKEFLNLLDKYPEEGMLYYYIANAFSYLSDGIGLEYSLRFYKKALTLIDYVEVWLDYGNALRVMKRTEEAIAVLEEARVRFYEDGSPAMILMDTYSDEVHRKVMKSEWTRKKQTRFHKVIREWESEHQILKEQSEDFI